MKTAAGASIPNGPSNISLGVKAYFALKLMGWSPDHPVLVKAREWILANGGVTECNTFTKIYLCFMGQYEYDAVPAVPPELVLFPKWWYFNIYEISAWSRAHPRAAVDRLCEEAVQKALAGAGNRRALRRWPRECASPSEVGQEEALGWRNIFLVADRIAHWAERVHIRPLRKIALKKAEKWMLERFEKSDGLGAIYPAMLNAIIALRCLGYTPDDPQFIRAMDEFEKLGIDNPEGRTALPDSDLPHAALRLAGVGHGAGGLRARRGRRCER